jgi:HSP20 family protein
MFSRLNPTKSDEKNTMQKSSVKEADRPTRAPFANSMELENQYSLYVSMPGVSPDQVHLTVNDGLLTVRGTVQNHHYLDVSLTHQEFSPQDFQRAFNVPKDIEIDEISATSKNGILEVILPKVSAAQPRRIQVTSA